MKHSIVHEFTAPYSSAQNGLAERAIRTTMDDVRTLLKDSGLSHSFWAEAAAYSVYTQNLIPSRRHPGKILMESFTGRRQNVVHLRAFGSRCWAKVPTVYGVQVMGRSKLDDHGVKCVFLGYMPGHGNFKVQEDGSCQVFVSRDVVFEEGIPHRTSPIVGEPVITQLFDALETTNDSVGRTPGKDGQQPKNNQPPITSAISGPEHSGSDLPEPDLVDHADTSVPANPDISVPMANPEPRRSTRIVKPSAEILESKEYQQREAAGQSGREDWATETRRPYAPSISADRTNIELDEYIACIEEMKASHNIPRSYTHAMATNPDRWMLPMEVEMETLKKKCTWDLVKPPPGANVMGSMWVYDIKWDGEGNRIKDKARLVGKGYTQQLGINYNETWAGVTRLESVRMTTAIAAKHDLKLRGIDFVGAYLNSLTKEDIYMKQPEEFVEPGLEDHICKLVHTIYGTMQGAHDWYETLLVTYTKLGYNTSSTVST